MHESVIQRTTASHHSRFQTLFAIWNHHFRLTQHFNLPHLYQYQNTAIPGVIYLLLDIVWICTVRLHRDCWSPLKIRYRSALYIRETSSAIPVRVSYAS